MQNPAPFTLEWTALNRATRFTDFLIYTNDCEDGTDAIAEHLAGNGIVHHVSNNLKRGASPQRTALRMATKTDLYRQSDWVICADCDEFLNIRIGDGTLDDLFAAVGEADAISLCWKLFGNAGKAKYRDNFIISQFDASASENYRGSPKALGLKTLFRPSDCIPRMGVHRPKFSDDRGAFIWKDAGGHLMPEKYFSTGWSAHKNFSNEFARLHHYAVRSTDSFLVKRDRGRTNHVNDDQGLEYWSDLNVNTERDVSLFRMVDKTNEEFEHLMADDLIADAHQKACRWHKKKIDDLKSKHSWLEFHKSLQAINRPPNGHKGSSDAALRGADE